MNLGVNSGNTFNKKREETLCRGKTCIKPWLLFSFLFFFILFLIHGELIRELLHSIQPVAVLQEKLVKVCSAFHKNNCFLTSAI